MPSSVRGELFNSGTAALPAWAGPAAGLFLAPLAARRASEPHAGSPRHYRGLGLFPMLCNKALARMLVFKQKNYENEGIIGVK